MTKKHDPKTLRYVSRRLKWYSRDHARLSQTAGSNARRREHALRCFYGEQLAYIFLCDAKTIERAQKKAKAR